MKKRFMLVVAAVLVAAASAHAQMDTDSLGAAPTQHSACRATRTQSGSPVR